MAEAGLVARNERWTATAFRNDQVLGLARHHHRHTRPVVGGSTRAHRDQVRSAGQREGTAEDCLARSRLREHFRRTAVDGNAHQAGRTCEDDVIEAAPRPVLALLCLRDVARQPAIETEDLDCRAGRERDGPAVW